MILDLFGGMGGWAEGLGLLGLAEIGVELDPVACATRRAAGHRVIRADVTRFPVGHLAGRVEGLIASPPCQAFSTAGKGDARGHLDLLVADVTRGKWGCRQSPHRHVGVEVLELGRWAETIRPRWVVCEQVPPVLPVWQAYAQRWRALGWSTWAGILNAADFGVSQTRSRAFLVARADGPALPPEPTHAKYPQDSLFAELKPWVSMAEALGWVGQDEPARTVCGDRVPRWLYPDGDGTHGRVVLDRRQSKDGEPVRLIDCTAEPAPTLTGEGGRCSWVVRTCNNSMVTGRTADDIERYERPVTEPAPTLDGKAGTAWTLNPGRTASQPNRRARLADQPAPTVAFGNDANSWGWERPSTTVAGDPRLSGPGRNDPAVPGSQYGENTVKLTLTEALILQSFRADYPVQGNKTQRFRQIGDAVPPRLATAVVGALIGVDWRGTTEAAA